MENDPLPTKFNHVVLKFVCVRKNNTPVEARKELFLSTNSSDSSRELTSKNTRRQTKMTTFEKWKL